MSDMEWRHNPDKFPFSSLTQFQKSVRNYDHMIIRYKECLSDVEVINKYWFLKVMLVDKLEETSKLRDEILGYIEKGYNSWAEVPFGVRFSEAVLKEIQG